MAAVLQTPTFPEAILQREKIRSIAALKEAETKPESIASKAFNQAVFGAHPYGTQTAVSDVEKFTATIYLIFIAAITPPMVPLWQSWVTLLMPKPKRLRNV